MSQKIPVLRRRFGWLLTFQKRLKIALVHPETRRCPQPGLVQKVDCSKFFPFKQITHIPSVLWQKCLQIGVFGPGHRRFDGKNL